MAENILTFDFGDGPVLAHQHINPDGTLGGWVADMAYVDGTCYIGPNVQIFGNTSIRNNVCIKDNVKVYGCASVHDNVKLSGNVQLYDFTAVSDGADISGNTIISGKSNIQRKVFIYGNSVLKDVRLYMEENIVYVNLEYPFIGPQPYNCYDNNDPLFDMLQNIAAKHKCDAALVGYTPYNPDNNMCFLPFEGAPEHIDAFIENIKRFLTEKFENNFTVKITKDVRGMMGY